MYDQFRAEVDRIKPPDVSKAAINEVVLSKILPAKFKEMIQTGTLAFYPYEARSVVEEATRSEASFADDAKPDSKHTHSLVAQASDVITSDALCEALEHEVLEVRRALFGSGRVPFRRSELALKWIERLSIEERNLCVPGSFDEVQKATADLRRLACADIQLNLKSVAYPMFDKRRGKSYVGRTSCPYGGKLYTLASASDRLAKTGFNKAAVTWWILVGRRPLLPRFRLTEHTGSFRNYISVEINARDLRWSELRELYRQVRALPNTRRQVVNRLHERIYQLVQKFGTPKRHGQWTHFWERIRQRLVKERFKDVPRTWQAIRKAYHAVAPKKLWSHDARGHSTKGLSYRR